MPRRSGLGLDVEVHAKIVLGVHNGPGGAGIVAHGAQRVALLLQLAHDGVSALAHLKADVVHAVAVLVQELAEGGRVLVGLVQLDDKAALTAVDDGELEAVIGLPSRMGGTGTPNRSAQVLAAFSMSSTTSAIWIKPLSPILFSMVSSLPDCVFTQTKGMAFAVPYQCTTARPVCQFLPAARRAHPVNEL